MFGDVGHSKLMAGRLPADGWPTMFRPQILAVNIFFSDRIDTSNSPLIFLRVSGMVLSSRFHHIGITLVDILLSLSYHSVIRTI